LLKLEIHLDHGLGFMVIELEKNEELGMPKNKELGVWRRA
jgi:hypothetical protein